MIKDILIAVISGGVAAAIFKILGDKLAWKRERKAQKEDRAEQRSDDEKKQAALQIDRRLTDIEAKTDAQSTALMFILYDRIRYLGQAYIAAESVDFDDRHILNEMHKAYHEGLGGNGDLNVLMREVNSLPLRKQR